MSESASKPLPPNQQLVAKEKWPIVGEKFPRQVNSPWQLRVTGHVESPKTWSLELLKTWPQTTREIDIHCVTRWSKLKVSFSGVLLADVFSAVRVSDDAKFVSFRARSEQNHSTSLPIEYLSKVPAMIAFAADGVPLPESHGGPIRMVVPGKYFYKSVKWLEEIELLNRDQLGFWEANAGYHNQADPWLEQRFIASSLSKQQVAKLLTQRDFSDGDLMGISAAGLELNGLRAHNALLRNGDFRETKLQRADFSGANLSGAHFQNADLRNARFVDADIEGANFCGADLRSADFTGASLFGVSFISEDGSNKARFDEQTRLDADAISRLTPFQENFVRASLERKN